MKSNASKFIYASFISLAASAVSFASDSKLLQINCYSGGDGNRPTFSGWIKGNVELNGEKFTVTGSEISAFTTTIQNSACRDFYDDFWVYDDGRIVTTRKKRGWNALIVKSSQGITYLSCGIGSRVTEFADSKYVVRLLSNHRIESVDATTHIEHTVSSSACILDGLTNSIQE